MSKCSFEGCLNNASRVGLCASHYNQKRAGKELKPLQLQYHGYTEEKRFMQRVKKVDSGCWEWQGSTNAEGWHGQWRNKSGGIELTHRASWRMFNGEIPKGIFVLHKCDNPICVNPKHLFLGTQSDNAKDMWIKNRGNPGKSQGEKHGMAKVNEETVREIRSSSESGVALANKFGISRTTVSEIRKRKTWCHI
jgi:hypothetical protein